MKTVPETSSPRRGFSVLRFIGGGALFTLLLFLYAAGVFASGSWSAFGSDPAHTFSVLGVNAALNETLIRSTAQSTSTFNEPLVADLNGDGLMEVVFVSNNYLRVYDSALVGLADVNIPYSWNYQIALTSSAQCRTPAELGIALITNPPITSEPVTFQVWCLNSSNRLYRSSSTTIWPVGWVNSTIADAGSGVSCDDSLCVFRSARNDSINALWACTMSSFPPLCSGYPSASVANAASFYSIPTISEFEKSDGLPEVIFLSDANGDGLLGFTAFHQSFTNWTPYIDGLVVDDIGLPNPDKPFLTVIDRGEGNNNYVAFYQKENRPYGATAQRVRVFDSAGSNVWTSVSPSLYWGSHYSDIHFGYSNLVARPGLGYCQYFSGFSDFDLGYTRGVVCYDGEGTITFQDAGEAGWGGALSYETLLKASGVDVQGDGVVDMVLGSVVANVSAAYAQVVPGANVSLAGLATYLLQPVDVNGDGLTDYVMHDSSSTYLFYGTGSPSGFIPYGAVCYDTDKASRPTINYTLRGTVSYLGGNQTDYCVGTGSLVEFYCQSGIAGGVAFNTVTCAGGCIDGHCLECDEVWNCSAWTPCNDNDTMTRACIDSTHCGTSYFLPAQVANCTGSYRPLKLARELVVVPQGGDPLNATVGLLPETYSTIMVFFSHIGIPLFIILAAVGVAMLVGLFFTLLGRFIERGRL